MFQIEESSTYQMIKENGGQETLSEAQQRFGQRITEILRKRFGLVPSTLTERLHGLSLIQLDHALANALEADSLHAFIDSL